jgi:ubiquinone/menaquinone biosynthesis C-methylase UbiE
MKEKIKEYWEGRAKQHISSTSATTEDIFLRELEIYAIIQTIYEINLHSGHSLDVGCGDGYSTLSVAEAIPTISFLGIDYSENMIKIARERLETHPEFKDRIEFTVGDVTNLKQACNDMFFDLILTDRCLINLESTETQSHAISEIAAHIKPSGYYIAIENFIEGHDNMNNARHSVGLPEIPVRWHNLYFKERDFIHSAERFFKVLEIKDFSSSYYFATRVIYSKMCQMRGEKPDYNHEIHQLAVKLPWVGKFSPIKMAVLRRN